jgi:hypothetical protein
MKGLLIILVFLTGCSHADSWRRSDTMLQLAVTGVMIADAVTTSRIQYHPPHYESGPVARQFLGRQPSTSDTYQYFGTVAVTSYLISRALPHRWRRYWQVWGIGVHGYAVGQNCNNGLC